MKRRRSCCRMEEKLPPAKNASRDRLNNAVDDHGKHFLRLDDGGSVSTRLGKDQQHRFFPLHHGD